MTNTLLTIDGWAIVFAFDQEIAINHKGRKDHQAEDRHNDVGESLGESLDDGHAIIDEICRFIFGAH